jgi:signal peptidase I
MENPPNPGEIPPQIGPELPDMIGQSEKKAQARRMIIDIIETIVLALVLYFGIDAISARVRVQNISMQPTLYEGEFVLVSKISYKFGPPMTGDIIVFHAPTEPGEDFVKRVIGTPGDTVKVSQGKVYVNDYRLDEPYIADVPNYEGEWVVPSGQLFVLGDNRNQSSDSHRWGFVPMDKVVGKALMIYWPFNQAAILEHHDVVRAAQN